MLQMLLPTCELEDLDPSFIEDWLPVIQGPILAEAEADDDQRALILRIALTYRAFLEGRPGVNPIDYNTFVALLVHGTLNVDPQEDAAVELALVDEWIEENIPVVRPLTAYLRSE